jgi:bifunctional N-acetylglucosamine-1-phosphate-uridyltransferase/glucosamine-1-phosphate-acetyltransferase GlmU-like protein
MKNPRHNFDNWLVVILAAGKGTRMSGDLPKVIMDFHEKPILNWGIDTLKSAGMKNILIVTHWQADLIEDIVRSSYKDISFYRVSRLLGTADTLRETLLEIPASKCSKILVLFGDDLALYTPKSITELVKEHENKKSKATYLTLLKRKPTDIGGLDKDINGNVVRVLTRSMLEKKQLKSYEIVCGAFCFDAQWIKKILPQIEKNPYSGEYPLPGGVITVALSNGEYVKTFRLKNAMEWNSINTVNEFKEAHKKKSQLLSKL